MTLIGLLGAILFYVKSINKKIIDVVTMKSIIIGFIIPSFDRIIEIILFIFYYEESEKGQSLDVLFFHSIFVIILISLLIKIFVEYFPKVGFKAIFKGLIIGYFSYIFLEIIFLVDEIYLFWPINDSDLTLRLNLFSIKHIGFNFYSYSFFSISLDFLFFYLFGKLIIELILEEKIPTSMFFKVNKWVKFQGIIFATSLIATVTAIYFSLNINLLLLLYMLFYILSIAQYLAIVLKTNFKINAAKIN